MATSRRPASTPEERAAWAANRKWWSDEFGSAKQTVARVYTKVTGSLTDATVEVKSGGATLGGDLDVKKGDLKTNEGFDRNGGLPTVGNTSVQATQTWHLWDPPAAPATPPAK
jgi:hypothetical protein